MSPPALFVYGTLHPGDVRWPIIEPHVVSTEPATVGGRLYDTGRGYPGAVFGGDRTISGLVLHLDPSSLRSALASLDEAEGAVWGLYRRVEVTSDAGLAVWAYELGESPEGMVDLMGVWSSPGA